MDKAKSPWTVPVAADDISEAGLHIEVEAPESVRTEVASIAGLRALPRLSAVFDLARKGAGVRVTGEVHARVGQTCVVTLEAIENNLEEPVDLVFAPATAEAEAKDEAKNSGEPPEPLVGGKLDLGAIATEFLLLGIDPFPRKMGAEFAPLKTDVKTDDGSARPFAALEALKKRLGGG